MQLRTGSREIENEPPVLEPCFGSVVNESLVTSPPCHVQPDLVVLKSQLIAAIACPIHKLKAHIFHGATVRDVRKLERWDQIGHATSLLEVHLGVAIAYCLQELEQLNFGNLPLPLLQKIPVVQGAEHDRLQLVQGTLNVDTGCILPSVVVPVQHEVTQRRVKELGLLGFGCVHGVLAHETFGFLLHCGRFTLERRIDNGFVLLIIVLLILDTSLLAALPELLEGGLPPTAALEELLGLRHNQVPCAKNVNTRVEVDFLRKVVCL